MLHSGCEYYGLQSACYDVPWYDDFFPAEKHSETEQRVILNWWFLLIEVIYHQRMNILSSIGLMTLFQFAFTLHVVLNSVQVHGSKKTLKFLLSWLWAWDLRQGDCDQMPHAGSEYPVRRGCSCALSIVHCRISWFYNDFCFSTLSTFNIHGLPCGGLPSWYVCVCPLCPPACWNLDMIRLECCSWCLVKKSRSRGSTHRSWFRSSGLAQISCEIHQYQLICLPIPRLLASCRQRWLLVRFQRQQASKAHCIFVN